MGEIFTSNIEMERVQVNGMDNLCRRLGSRSFQFVVSVPLGTDFWPLSLAGKIWIRCMGIWGILMKLVHCILTIRIGSHHQGIGHRHIGIGPRHQGIGSRHQGIGPHYYYLAIQNCQVDLLEPFGKMT